MKKNTVKLNEQQLKKVIGESVKKVLKEWDDFKISDDFKLSDDMPFGTDKVTPGDSLPIISQAPRNDNRFNYFSDKEMLKLSIRNQIENKEGLKNSYSLKDLSKDIARRFKIDPVESFEMVKKIYKKIGGYHAIDENRIKIKESQLKKIVAESVKKVLKEGIKAADAMNATTPELAKECGFELEYVNVDGGFQLWEGPLPEDYQKKMLLLRKLGINKFTSENYMNGTCRITVDPSGKIANIVKKGSNPILRKLAELLKQNKISSNKAVQILVSKGFDENKARTWVTKYTPKFSY